MPKGGSALVVMNRVLVDVKWCLFPLVSLFQSLVSRPLRFFQQEQVR